MQEMPEEKPEACNFIKKETLAQALSCKFYEVPTNTFFTEHLWATASVDLKKNNLKQQIM